MGQTLFLESISEIIEERKLIFNQPNSITDRNTIPVIFPLSPNQWYKIKDVICIFVDIRRSTALSATANENKTASVYEYFSGTAIRIFHEFGADYIDIKGDGVFALFNKDKIFTSFAAAITFKTFATKYFLKGIKSKLGSDLDVGFHMGIDQKTVLVKSLGLKDHESRDRRKNEVWAGKPINMAAKLASLSNDSELYVSDRYLKALGKNELVNKTCGCMDGSFTGEKSDIWIEKNVTENTNFDFSSCYVLKTHWCENHGQEWCRKIMDLDNP